VASARPYEYSRRSNMRVANYVRVSTEEQAKFGFSLDEQRRTLQQHADRQGWEVIEEVSDPGDSGADPDRPGLLRILELAEAGRVDLVLSWKRDRLFRDIYFRRNFEQDLAEYGVRTVSLNDTGSRVGDKIIDVLGEEEREQIKDRTRAGKLGKARRGLMPGGNQVHFGFRFAGDTAERYEVDPAKMALVARIFHMVGVEGRSLTAIKSAFEAEHIPTPRGARWWNISTIKRLADNDVYLSRPYEEVAALVSPEVAGRLDPAERYGVYWYGRVHMRRNYGRYARRKFTIEQNDSKEWVAIPVPDSGIPPEWVEAARRAIKDNVQWRPNTHPAVRLRGRIRCACGYSMTNLENGGRRYYVCSQHRKRGRCEHVRFHRLFETEERVERFVLRLIQNPDELREKVEERAECERRALRNTGREIRRIRQRLDKLAVMEDGYSEQQAEGLISMDRLREKLAGLAGERAELERRLAELADGERRLRELEELPALIKQYLRDLPYLVDRKRTVRKYEVAGGERTPENPLGVYTLTSENISFLTDEERERREKEAERERSARFRELYELLDLRVVCHKDRSLEVTWGVDCREWLGRG
jgi:site-specific DNA recombinase